MNQLTDNQQEYKDKIIWQRRVLRFCRDHGLKHKFAPHSNIRIKMPDGWVLLKLGEKVGPLKEKLGATG